jgi:phosphate starvation-inducible protein PhoH and related proteins
MSKQTREPTTDRGPRRSVKIALQFDRTDLLSLVFGEFDQYLIAIENSLGIYIAARGGALTIEGDPMAAAQARDTILALYARAEQSQPIGQDDIDDALGLSLRATAASGDGARLFGENEAPMEIRTRRKVIAARTPTQGRYMQALASKDIIFALGPAGTGKTYVAVAQAVAQLIGGSVDRIILSRPAVEAGERLGFLPGDLKEKIDPYLRPLYDALHDMLPADQVERRIANGEIEIAPLAFMRGRTLGDAFVILDEAQNTTAMQMKMFLTRFGQRCRMVVCGDPHQVDLPSNVTSGLADAVKRLEGVDGISMIRFDPKEVVRHPIVGRIVEAYGDGVGEKRL